ncbi:MAG: Isopenicillin synthase [Hyphomicrobiales bacterium]|nr:Isopenicillin synthase [Hyphomicrobiales bacterium]
MIIYTPPNPARSIPVVDLAAGGSLDGAGRRAIAQQIHRACRETGFFYVVGHGVPDSLVAAQFDAAKRFFDLPLAAKMALHMQASPSTAGYEPMGAQRLDSQDKDTPPSPPDFKESYYCAMDLPDDHPWARKRIRGYGHNQWPDLPGFRAQMLAYRRAVQQLGDRILSYIALSLDLERYWFEPYYDMPSGLVRMIKYPPQPADAAFNQIGAGAHTDWGGITILAQDSAGGLEVQNVEGEWIEATPIAGAFVINLGDLMSRWSNGVYRSNLHRVKNNSSERDRYSLPYFHSPRPDAVIAPIPTCVSDITPRLFEDCTCAQHMAEMFRRSYGYAPATA